MPASSLASSSSELYFDHAATSRPRPEVLDEFVRAWRDAPGNPGSAHGAGRAARERLEEARSRVARVLEVDPAGVIFCSGATEANNLALRGVRPGAALWVGATEHPSVRHTAEALRERGRPGGVLAVDVEGLIQPQTLDVALARAPGGLVSVMAVNNETGAAPDLPALAERCHAHGALLHVDAVQAALVRDVRPRALGADLVSLSAHKLGGPVGVGLLALADPLLPLEPVSTGGAQEGGRRAGTPAVALAAAAARALELAQGEHQAQARRLSALRGRLLAGLAARAEEVSVQGPADERWRAPHIINVALSALAGEVLAARLDAAGVRISTAAACASGRGGPSAVLSAMGLPLAIVKAAVRISMGWDTSAAEVDDLLDRLDPILRALAALVP